jgi:hypothetical protein
VASAISTGSYSADASARKLRQIRDKSTAPRCGGGNRYCDAQDHASVRPASHRGKTLSKLFALEPLGLALSEKQILQIVETIRSVLELKEALEAIWLRTRQGPIRH